MITHEKCPIHKKDFKGLEKGCMVGSTEKPQRKEHCGRSYTEDLMMSE